MDENGSYLLPHKRVRHYLWTKTDILDSKHLTRKVQTKFSNKTKFARHVCLLVAAGIHVIKGKVSNS